MRNHSDARITIEHDDLVRGVRGSLLWTLFVDCSLSGKDIGFNQILLSVWKPFLKRLQPDIQPNSMKPLRPQGKYFISILFHQFRISYMRYAFSALYAIRRTNLEVLWILVIGTSVQFLKHLSNSYFFLFRASFYIFGNGKGGCMIRGLRHASYFYLGPDNGGMFQNRFRECDERDHS